MSAIFPTTRRPSRSSSAARHVVERVLVRPDRVDVPAGDHRQQVAEQRPLIVGVLHGPDAPVDADHGAVAQEHLVERDGGDIAGGEADDAVTAPIAEGAQRGLRQRAADRVDHHVDTGPARPRTRRVLHGLAGRVDHRLGARPQRRRPLRLGRRHAEHPAAERARHADGGEADTAAGAQHEHALARLAPGSRAQGVEARAVALGERRRPRHVEHVGDHRDRRGRGRHLGGETTEARRDQDALAHLQVRDPLADGGDHPGGLGARHERHRRLDLVLPRHEQRRPT